MRRWICWLMLLAGCCPPLFAEKKLSVVTTFPPAYCFAANVAGSAATVENLVSGSVSLHDYQLSPADLAKLARADVIIVNGLGMESFLDRAVKSLGPNTSRKIVTLSAGLKSELIADNPHIWLDPHLARHSVSNITSALEKAAPDKAEIFRANAVRYQTRLETLNRDLAQKLTPVQNKPFVTYHNAFPYLARRYSLAVAGVVEETPEVAPTARQRSALLKTIRDQHVKVLFTGPGESPRLAAQLAKDAGLRLAELDPLETGPLSPSFYEEGMRRNAETLLQNLQ